MIVFFFCCICTHIFVILLKVDLWLSAYYTLPETKNKLKSSRSSKLLQVSICEYSVNIKMILFYLLIDSLLNNYCGFYFVVIFVLSRWHNGLILSLSFQRLPARNTAHLWSWGEPPADRSAPERNPPCSGTIHLLSETDKWASVRKTANQKIGIWADARKLTPVLICILFAISLHKGHKAWEQKTHLILNVTYIVTNTI